MDNSSSFELYEEIVENKKSECFHVGISTVIYPRLPSSFFNESPDNNILSVNIAELSRVVCDDVLTTMQVCDIACRVNKCTGGE